MKSKSILFILIAAIALGSFTACSNGPTAPIYGSDVQGVTLANAPGYLAGVAAKFLGINDTKDTVNPADVTLNVLFNDGATLPYNGKELGLTLKTAGGDNGWMYVGANVFEVTFADGKKFNVNIDAYSIESIDVDLSGIEATTLPLDKAGKYTADDIDLTGISMIVKYNGGQPKDVSEEIADNANVKTMFVATLNDLATAEAKANQTITIDASTIVIEYLSQTYTLDEFNAYMKAIGGCAINVTGSKTLTITDTTKSIVSATAAQIVGEKGEYEIFTVGDSSTIAAVNYEITFTLSDEDEPVTVTKTDAAGEGGWDFTVISHVANWPFTKVGESVNMIIKASHPDYGTVEVPLPVAARADYPVAFTVTAKDVDDEDTEAKWGPESKVSTSQFAFAVASTDGWASGHEYTGTDDDKAPAWSETSFTPNITGFKIGAEAGDKYDVEFTYGGTVGLKAVEKAKLTDGITLVAQEEATVK